MDRSFDDLPSDVLFKDKHLLASSADLAVAHDGADAEDDRHDGETDADGDGPLFAVPLVLWAPDLVMSGAGLCLVHIGRQHRGSGQCSSIGQTAGSVCLTNTQVG